MHRRVFWDIPLTNLTGELRNKPSQAMYHYSMKVEQKAYHDLFLCVSISTSSRNIGLAARRILHLCRTGLRNGVSASCDTHDIPSSISMLDTTHI